MIEFRRNKIIISDDNGNNPVEFLMNSNNKAILLNTLRTMKSGEEYIIPNCNEAENGLGIMCNGDLLKFYTLPPNSKLTGYYRESWVSYSHIDSILDYYNGDRLIIPNCKKED